MRELVFITFVGYKSKILWKTSLSQVSLKSFSKIAYHLRFFSLTAVFVPNGQFWAIIEGTASFTRC